VLIHVAITENQNVIRNFEQATNIKCHDTNTLTLTELHHLSCSRLINSLYKHRSRSCRWELTLLSAGLLLRTVCHRRTKGSVLRKLAYSFLNGRRVAAETDFSPSTSVFLPVSLHQCPIHIQWGMLQRTMLQRTNATTNKDTTTNADEYYQPT